jgi:hypothetical protein
MRDGAFRNIENRQVLNVLHDCYKTRGYRFLRAREEYRKATLMTRGGPADELHPRLQFSIPPHMYGRYEFIGNVYSNGRRNTSGNGKPQNQAMQEASSSFHSTRNKRSSQALPGREPGIFGDDDAISNATVKRPMVLLVLFLSALN